MSNSSKKVQKYADTTKIATRLRCDFNDCDYILIYAFNGTGKTRLSMDFKDSSKKRKKNPETDTLYFNAYTEDLFSWDNDLEKDEARVLKLNSSAKFFKGFVELAMDEKIKNHLDRYADFSFDIDYKTESISFKKEVLTDVWIEGKKTQKLETVYNIKISRGEETIFVWCVFLAICELALAKDNAYKWVKYIYIDDPISSLDENNAIAVATHLATMFKKQTDGDKIKAVISSHHTLFFNVMCNELKTNGSIRYFLHKDADNVYTLQKTSDTPFFHHIATLSELNEVAKSNKIYTYHFNALRSILEKTASFFGFDDFGKCIDKIDDAALFTRALNLLSHGQYSLYAPVEMVADNKDLFRRILTAFLQKYKFDLPNLLAPQAAALTPLPPQP